MYNYKDGIFIFDTFFDGTNHQDEVVVACVKPQESVTVPSTVSYKGKKYKIAKIGRIIEQVSSDYTEKIKDDRYKSGYREGRHHDAEIKIYNWRGVKEIIVPDTITSIGYIGEDNPGFESMRIAPKSFLSGLFTKKDKTHSVEIPNGVTKICERCFAGCEKIEHFSIPDTVNTIEEGAFSGCSSLKSIVIPNGVTRIENRLFSSCRSLTSVTIPIGVKSIGDFAFYDCESLTSLMIPDSVGYIGSSAFHGCSGLTSINIPNITSLYDHVFSCCSGLKMIELPKSVTNIEDSAFSFCESLDEIEIPNSVTNIGTDAFANCSSLTKIEIPDSVKSIGSGIFSGCKSLSAVIFRNELTCIGAETFKGCSSLNSYVIPNSVSSIGDRAFSGCVSLSSVTIPNSVKIIGDSAFSCCESLSRIEIPSSVTSIGSYAFSHCSLLTSITIPDNVNKIGDSAFDSCTALKSVTISNNVTNVGQLFFEGCPALTSPIYNAHCFIKMPSDYKGEYSIPYGISQIVRYAFNQCNEITKITIPDSVTDIEDSAFDGCSNLKSITIPMSVKKIERSAFSHCASLEVVNIENEEDAIEIDRDVFGIVSYYFSNAKINYLGKPQKQQKAEAPKAEAPKPEAPKPAEPMNEAPKPEPKPAPQPEPKKEEAKLADNNLNGYRIEEQANGGYIVYKDGEECSNAKAAMREMAALIGMEYDEGWNTRQFGKKLLNAISNSGASSPKLAEPAKQDPKPAASADGQTVADLAAKFREQFGSVLRIYNGRSKADDNASLQSLGLNKTISWEFDGNQKVGDFIQMMADAGLKVKVYTCDEWVAVIDGLTLEQSGKVKKSAVKADMEKML